MKKIYVVTGVLAALLLSSLTTFAQSESREDLLKAIDAKHKDISALENRLLQPAEEDRAKYTEFCKHGTPG